MAGGKAADFKRVGNQAVIRIDQHEAPLSKIGINLGALNGAEPKLIRFVMASFEQLLT